MLIECHAVASEANTVWVTSQWALQLAEAKLSAGAWLLQAARYPYCGVQSQQGRRKTWEATVAGGQVPARISA